MKVGKFAVIGIGSWSWCSWRRTYKFSKFILPHSDFSYKTKISHTDCSHFLSFSSHTFSIEMYFYSNTLRSLAKCSEVSTAWNIPCSSEERLHFRQLPKGGGSGVFSYENASEGQHFKLKKSTSPSPSPEKKTYLSLSRNNPSQRGTVISLKFTPFNHLLLMTPK